MEESPKLQVDGMNSSKMHPTKITNSKKNTSKGTFSKHDHECMKRNLSKISSRCWISVWSLVTSKFISSKRHRTSHLSPWFSAQRGFWYTELPIFRWIFQRLSLRRKWEKWILYIPTAVFFWATRFWGHVQKFLLVVFNLFVRNQRFVKVSSQHEKDIVCEIDSSFPWAEIDSTSRGTALFVDRRAAIFQSTIDSAKWASRLSSQRQCSQKSHRQLTKIHWKHTTCSSHYPPKV